jgi:iron complex transport system permease protein
VAGALMQALTRNPLADPGLLGVNAGAGAAAALSVSVFGVTDLRAFVWLAFVGAALAGAALYVISSSASPLRLALAGSAVAAALTGVTQAVVLLDRQALDQMRFWTVGSLVRANADSVRSIAPFLLVGLIIAFLLARPLNVLRLGDEVARSLGATAAVGPLVFVGLAVPHMVRALTGPDERWVVAYCTVLSPSLLLAADVIGRVIARSEIDVGVVTALLGGPVFLWLIRKMGARA